MSEHTSLQQASTFLGISPAAVRGLLAHGYLKGRKVDRVWQISWESLRLLSNLVHGPGGDPETPPSLLEQSRIPAEACPVCCGPHWGPASQGAEWSQEFRECADCAFSIHESFLDGQHHQALCQRVHFHLHQLLAVLQHGENARQCLQRRAHFLAQAQPLE